MHSLTLLALLCLPHSPPFCTPPSPCMGSFSRTSPLVVSWFPSCPLSYTDRICSGHCRCLCTVRHPQGEAISEKRTRERSQGNSGVVFSHPGKVLGFLPWTLSLPLGGPGLGLLQHRRDPWNYPWPWFGFMQVLKILPSFLLSSLEAERACFCISELGEERRMLSLVSGLSLSQLCSAYALGQP